MRRRTEPVESQATHHRKVSLRSSATSAVRDHCAMEASTHRVIAAAVYFNSAASWGVLVDNPKLGYLKSAWGADNPNKSTGTVSAWKCRFECRLGATRGAT
jgi:hypothetical protein